MARFIIPIPGLDPLYDRQVLVWRRTFDFGRSRDPDAADGASLRSRDWTHPMTRSRPGQVPLGASRDGRSKRPT